MTVVIACLPVRQWAAILGDHGRCTKKGFVLGLAVGFVAGWIAAFALRGIC